MKRVKESQVKRVKESQVKRVKESKRIETFMEFVVELKHGTLDGGTIPPLAQPEEFVTVMQFGEWAELMKSLRKIAGEKGIPTMRISLRFRDNGPVIIQSEETPLIFTDNPTIYPLHRVSA